MSGRLVGGIAIVTGASSGIGEAISRRFAAEGAAVVMVHHFDDEDASRIKKEIEEAGGRATTVGADVRDEAAADAVLEHAGQAFGRADILVNAAGVNAGGIKVADMDVERFRRTLETDVVGPFLFSRAFIRSAQVASGGGRILNVTSVHEETPQPGAADYCAAKGALRNLTRCLALELAAAGITVNNIAPGMVLTPMNQKAKDDAAVRDKMTANIPLKRAAEPEEVAALALYLASGEAAYATGASFILDGGFQFSVAQGA